MSELNYCPVCGSIRIKASRKGFRVGKILVDVVPPDGGDEKGDAVCLTCGHSWTDQKQDRDQELNPHLENEKAWRQAFYEAYESDDFSRADELYLTRYGGYGKQDADVHEAYERELRGDNQRVRSKLLATTIFTVVAVLLWQVLTC